ncbi:phosphatidylinositol 3,4,5-trisphosphate 3-phosphatase TPTE2-like [Thomomys bottae]
MSDIILMTSKLHIPLEYRTISLVIAIFFLLAAYFKDIQRMIVFFRLLRLITLMRIFHLATQKRHLEKLIRRLVSGNKRRYAKDGFDLDLTYITDRLVAMSFPSSGIHTFYRNPMQTARSWGPLKWTQKKQANECNYIKNKSSSEWPYDPKYFHHRVHRIMIDDHNVPTLE